MPGEVQVIQFTNSKPIEQDKAEKKGWVELEDCAKQKEQVPLRGDLKNASWANCKARPKGAADWSSKGDADLSPYKSPDAGKDTGPIKGAPRRGILA